MTLNERLQEAFDNRVDGTAILPASDLILAVAMMEQLEQDSARWKFVLHLITHGVALGNNYSVWDKPEEATRRIDAARKEILK